jgi:putative FmdB family regulatory protein
MPTYEYECKKCSHRFEVFQSMRDEPIKKCPECGKEVRRLVSGGVGVIFKGSGFYVTDKDKTSVPKSSTGSKKDTSSKSDSVSAGNSSKADSVSAEGGSKADSASAGGGTPKGDADSKGDGKAKGKAKPAA